MINRSLCPSTLLAGHAFHNGVWRFFWYYQAFNRPLHRYPSLTLLQQTVEVVELPTPTLASTPLTLSTSVGDDVTKLLERLLSIVLMTS